MMRPKTTILQLEFDVSTTVRVEKWIHFDIRLHHLAKAVYQESKIVKGHGKQ